MEWDEGIVQVCHQPTYYSTSLIPSEPAPVVKLKHILNQPEGYDLASSPGFSAWKPGDEARYDMLTSLKC